jgi:hypothetical protein
MLKNYQEIHKGIKSPLNKEWRGLDIIIILFLTFYFTDIFLPTAIFFLKIVFTISIEINTTTPKPMMISRSDAEGLIIPKASRIDGI